MNRRERIDKIRTLAQRGATEGERAAARAALERMGEPVEAPQTAGSIINEMINTRPGAYFRHDPPTPQYNARSYQQANNMFNFYVEEMQDYITSMFSEFDDRFRAMRDAGLTNTEITDMIQNGTYMSWKPPKEST